MSRQRTIADWRTSIDAVDRELLCLLNRRAELALEVGRAKLRAGLPICDVKRERDVIDRSCRTNAGPLDETAVANIFRRIIHETRCFERRRATTTTMSKSPDRTPIQEGNQS